MGIDFKTLCKNPNIGSKIFQTAEDVLPLTWGKIDYFEEKFEDTEVDSFTIMTAIEDESLFFETQELFCQMNQTNDLLARVQVKKVELIPPLQTYISCNFISWIWV
jgi:hypothetical protein